MYTDNNDNEFSNNDNNNTFNAVENDTNYESNSDIDNDFYKYENQQYEMDNKPKKSKKVILWIIIVLIILVALLGTLAFFYFRENNNSGNGTVTPNLVLNITEFNLKVNDTKKIEYTIENDNSNVAINWSSSDTKIATVDNTGTVKGIKDGTVTITASYTIDGKTYEKTCKVTVAKDSSSSTQPSVEFQITSLNLKVGASGKIQYKVENGNVAINWSSSDTKIATVDKNGTVKGIKEGNATITATYTINGKKTTKNITVKVTSNNTGGSSETTDKTDPKLSVSFTKGKENTWVNTDVEIKTTASDNSGSVTVEYALNCAIKTCEYKKVTNNTITISSENVTEVKIRATDKAGNDVEENVTVRIDKTKPTCSLKVAEDGTLSVDSASDTGGSELSYKGFSSTYSGTSETTKKLSAAGNQIYYVKDKAGNTNTCSLDVKTKTQYRYQECTSCKKCESAGCEWYYSDAYGDTWISNRNETAITARYKITCSKDSSTTYACQKYYCASYKMSCDKCGGCDSWGQFSTWSDTKYTETASRKVETKTVYYK